MEGDRTATRRIHRAADKDKVKFYKTPGCDPQKAARIFDDLVKKLLGDESRCSRRSSNRRIEFARRATQWEQTRRQPQDGVRLLLRAERTAKEDLTARWNRQSIVRTGRIGASSFHPFIRMMAAANDGPKFLLTIDRRSATWVGQAAAC